MRRRSTIHSFGAAAATTAAMALLVMGCKDSPATTSPELAVQATVSANDRSEIAQDELLRDVRRATARYNSTVQAAKAGYAEDDHCVEVPGLGGMGFHWVNEDLVDPIFDPLQPEAVLYAPGPGGNLRLVALEYIVIDIGQPQPHFGDQPFMVGGTPVPAPHWSLHVWLYEENPAGMFTPFNPNIVCP